MHRMVRLFAVVAVLLAAVTLPVVSAVESPPLASHPSGGHSLLQAKAKTYSAAAARASLHAGAKASTSRFHDMASRVGIDVAPHDSHPRRAAPHQNHHAMQQQAAMIDIVEKVLKAGKERTRHQSHDGSHAESLESEFHLMNALMEKQSSLREYAANSNERENIGGVSRKFLKQVTDNAIKNALHRLHDEHPRANLRTSTPVHLYGVRSPYNGQRDSLLETSTPHHSALYSAEARSDPYLSRNLHIDAKERVDALAQRTTPQMVYRLGRTDNQLLTEREIKRNQEYHHSHHHQHPHQNRPPAHAARRSVPTPKPVRRSTHPVSSVSHPRSAGHSVPLAHAQHAAQASNSPSHMGVPPPKTTLHEATKHAASKTTKPATVAAPAFLEVDSTLDFDHLHGLYLEELSQHASAHGDQPWFLHHAPGAVDDSQTASKSLADLMADFRPDERYLQPTLEDMESDEINMLELDSEQSPLRELGILMGLNPDKKPTPTPASNNKPNPTTPTSNVKPPTATATTTVGTLQAKPTTTINTVNAASKPTTPNPNTATTAKAPKPNPMTPPLNVKPNTIPGRKVPHVQPRFTQVRGRSGMHAKAGVRARDDGEEAAGGDDAAAGGDDAAAAGGDDASAAGGSSDDLEAMVNAGDAYKPSPLKHPPPPPVPPPPPPPPPPKFSAE